MITPLRIYKKTPLTAVKAKGKKGEIRKNVAKKNHKNGRNWCRKYGKKSVHFPKCQKKPFEPSEAGVLGVILTSNISHHFDFEHFECPNNKLGQMCQPGFKKNAQC